MANGQLAALGGMRIGKPYARTNSFCQEGKNLSLKMATSPQKPKEISILNTQKLHFLWQMNCISLAFSNSTQTLPNLQKHLLLPGMCAPIMPALPWNNASIATEPKFKFSTHITVEVLQKEIGWQRTSWLNFFVKNYKYSPQRTPYLGPSDYEHSEHNICLPFLVTLFLQPRQAA